jgi:predicted GNAT family acetyltransferase
VSTDEGDGGPDTEPRVVDDRDAHRYELWVGGELAGTISYAASRNAVALIHTEVDPAFAGRGLGARIVAGALDDLEARGLRLVPVCPFVRDYLSDHREFEHLVERNRGVR